MYICRTFFMHLKLFVRQGLRTYRLTFTKIYMHGTFQNRKPMAVMYMYKRRHRFWLCRRAQPRMRNLYWTLSSESASSTVLFQMTLVDYRLFTLNFYNDQTIRKPFCRKYPGIILTIVSLFEQGSFQNQAIQPSG